MKGSLVSVQKSENLGAPEALRVAGLSSIHEEAQGKPAHHIVKALCKA